LENVLQDCTSFQIALVGNPNCGKTTLFNHLTGLKQKVGNWPGVTVERKEGNIKRSNRLFKVVDLPGIYSLSANSLDEKVARDYVLNGHADIIVDIIDATNLERSLYLTAQLLEMGLPILVCLNMMDSLEQNGQTIDIPVLERRLGCKIVPTIAKSKKGIEDLLQCVEKINRQPLLPVEHNFSQIFRKNHKDLAKAIPKANLRAKEREDWVALKILEGDVEIANKFDDNIQKIATKARKEIEHESGKSPAVLIEEARLYWATRVAKEVKTEPQQRKLSKSERLDNIFLHPFWGLPIFLFAMYVTFMITINASAPFIDFVDRLAGYFLVDQWGAFLEGIVGPGIIKTLLADGIGGGIQTVLTFIPPIGFMFVCLSFLEDSGYMSRASFVLDRSLRKIGLPGRAVVPMIVGFGCSVPAVMSCRTMQDEAERRQTMAMVPFMSCGAKLPVYALFATAFFPTNGQNVVFSLYLLGIVAAVLTGLLLRKSLFQGAANPLLLELPTYNWPAMSSLFSTSWHKLKRFLINAGKLIVLIVAILTLMNSVTFSGKQSKGLDSILSKTSQAITPIFYSIGITDENWPATVGILSGIFAKEAIIGTLDSLYSQQAHVTGKIEETIPGVGETLSSAFSGLKIGLLDMVNQWSDPIGIDIGFTNDEAKALEKLEMQKAAFGVMVRYFDGQAGAYAYLLWVLLYAPCIAAITAILKESDNRWIIFTIVYMTIIAWTVATIFYQTATFATHPISSTSWITLALALLGSVVFIMKRWGAKALKTASLNFSNFNASCDGCTTGGCH